MKGIHAALGRALVLTIALITIHSSLAQSGYTVTARGPDYNIHQKTVVRNGTNCILSYVELATGLNYTNASGQLVPASDQITILPNGGAAAVQGRHQVYFPADIYNGVLEVITPGGLHLKSRPLGVSYDDGSNTVFIATLKDAVGYLTSSNTVTYRDCFEGIHADLVCQYRRGGFSSELVLRQRPPTPGDYNLDEGYSTLQMVTEFFDTADPQQIPAASDEWYGLQDQTLKFGGLTMTHGKAFAFNSTNALPQPPDARTQTPVYKSWQHIGGRTFLIEQVPVLNIADNLNALPLTASIHKPSKVKLASLITPHSSLATFPPAHGFAADTNQILLATADVTHEPGVVLDYNEVNSGQTDFNFASGSTYLIDGFVYLDGTTAFQAGAVLKFNNTGSATAFLELADDSTVVCSPDAAAPTIFTSFNDDSVGDPISGSSGSPDVSADMCWFLNIDCPSLVLSNMDFYYASTAIQVNDGNLDLWNCRFLPVDIALQAYGDDASLGNVGLHNVLFQEVWNDNPISQANYAYAENVTLDGWVSMGADAQQTNCLVVGETVAAGTGAPFVPAGGAYVSVDGSAFTYSATSIFKSAANANFYLASGSAYRGAGTTNISPDLLAELQTMTTYAPQDGGWPDTNGTDLGYHYPANEDSDFDGLPDWWELHWFGTYAFTSTNMDGNGNTLLYDYQNALDPDAINFTVRLGNEHFTTTNATGTFLVLGGLPSYEAVLVNNTNFDTAIWTNYDGNVAMNLGPTDGVYQVWFGLKGFATNATTNWIGTTVYLDRAAPTVIITSPTNSSATVPYLQVQGYATEELGGVTFDVSNAVAMLTNQPAQLLGGQFFDTNQWQYTTDYFQCYDILLTNGLNTITLHATDLAGNATNISLSMTLDYSLATNPVIQLTWPTNGMVLCGTNFNLRGWVDDPTAGITAAITDTNGDTNFVTGSVERTGGFWVENLPLNSGTNRITLWVTNAAGLSNLTNFYVVKSDMTLAVTNINGDLWLPTVGVSGLVSDTTAAIFVNNVAGTNNGDGTWSAVNVPVSPGGVASFDLRAVPAGGGDPDTGFDTDKTTEILMDSAHWHSGSTAVLEFDVEIDQLTGDYTYTNGGEVVDRFEAVYPFEDYVEYTFWELAPDGTVTDKYWYDSEGLSGDAGPGGSYPIAQEEGSLDCGQQGNILSQHKDSKVKMVLHTGGTGLPGLSWTQSLFQLNATATEELPQPVFVTGGPSSPPGQIKMAGKTLGFDGYAYATFQDFTALDATPIASGPPMYSFTKYQQKYHPFITLTTSTVNANLDTDMPEVCVGQTVVLGADWAGNTGPTYAAADIRWHLPDKYVNEQYNYSDVCTSYRQNANALTNSAIQCWYVNLPGGACSVREILTFANGQSATVAAAGNFTVFRPKAYFMSDGGASVVLGTSGLPNVYMGVGDNNTGAMGWKIDVHLNPKYPASIYYTQIIDRDWDWDRQGGLGAYLPKSDHTYDYVLDTEIKYSAANIFNNSGTNLELELHFGDGPDLEDTLHSYADCQDQFETYLEFQPIGGIPVTLGVTEWGWHGRVDGSYSTSTWSLTTNLITGPAFYDYYDDFPVWPSVYTGH